MRPLLRPFLISSTLALSVYSPWGCAPSRSAPAFPPESGDLEKIVAELALAPEGSNAFLPPSEEELRVFRSALSNLLNGDTDSALEGLESLGMEIVRFTDATGPTFLLIRENRSPLRGWGLYALNTSSSRNLLIEAPHPGADLRTETQAARLFLDVSARGLLIAGAHRCASPDFSLCSGMTAVCSTSSTGEPFRISDASHEPGQIFEITHEVFFNSDITLKVVALHGFDRKAGDPHAFVSNGTDTPFNEESLSNRFTERLNEIAGSADAALSCNNASPGARLCGTDDVQGRYANGSPDACVEETAGATGRFLHIEQSLDLRTEGGEADPSSVQRVLEELF